MSIAFALDLAIIRIWLHKGYTRVLQPGQPHTARWLQESDAHRTPQLDKGDSLSVLGQIIRDNYEWRKRILRLALFDLRQESRGAMLSWGWFLLRPAAYLLCFWFAIGLGLRGAGNSGLEGLPPYFLWLSCGIIPWMFMREMLNKGAATMQRKRDLATSVRFPLSCIPSITVTASMIVQLALTGVLLIIYFASGMALDVYLLQLPILLLLMFLFWGVVACMLSILGAISKDVSQFISVLSTPLFWISGVIFNINSFPVEWMRPIFNLNPIAFFVEGFRDALYYKTWIFQDVHACIGFALVFLVTVATTVFVYSRFAKVVPDVL